MGCKPSKDSTAQVATGNMTSSSSKLQKKQSDQCVSNKEANVETEVYMDVPMPDDEAVEEKIEEDPILLDDKVDKKEEEEEEEVEEEEEEEEEESSIVEEETEEKSLIEEDNATSEENEDIIVVHENIEQVENAHLANIVEEEGKFIDADSPNRFFLTREEEVGDGVVASVEQLSESDGTKFESMETFPVVGVEDEEGSVLLSQDEEQKREADLNEENLMEKKQLEATMEMEMEMEMEKDVGEAE